jgi:hypothetical protein
MRKTIWLLLFAATSAAADPIIANRARMMLENVNAAVADLNKEAQHDAEVLRLLREASRSLDDFQKNSAVQKAMDNISRAERLGGTDRVTQAVFAAKKIVEPAKESAMSADFVKMRAELQARPIEMMRGIVADEVSVLAQIAAQLSDVSGTVTHAMAAATSTTLGSKAE